MTGTGLRPNDLRAERRESLRSRAPRELQFHVVGLQSGHWDGLLLNLNGIAVCQTGEAFFPEGRKRRSRGMTPYIYKEWGDEAWFDG